MVMRKIKDNFEKAGYMYDGGHTLFSTFVLPTDPTITEATYVTREGVEVPHQITLKLVKKIAWNDVRKYSL